MKETPALSPSIAHVIDSESPLHAWTIHRLLGNKPRPVTDAQEKGKLIESLLLDEGRGVMVIEAKDFRTKEAKEAREAARAQGLIPVPAPKYAEAQVIAGKIGKRIAECGISLEGGRVQERLEWYDGGVLCHGVLDWVSDDWRTIYDLKTSDQSAHPAACVRRMLDSHAVIQSSVYPDAVGILHPEVMGRVKMVFLCAETKDPYAVSPLIASGSMQEIGEMRWRRALKRWKECLEWNQWPAYVTKPTIVEPPGWALAKELEREVSE